MRTRDEDKRAVQKGVQGGGEQERTGGEDKREGE